MHSRERRCETYVLVFVGFRRLSQAAQVVIELTPARLAHLTAFYSGDVFDLGEFGKLSNDVRQVDGRAGTEAEANERYAAAAEAFLPNIAGAIDAIDVGMRNASLFSVVTKGLGMVGNAILWRVMLGGDGLNKMVAALQDRQVPLLRGDDPRRSPIADAGPNGFGLLPKITVGTFSGEAPGADVVALMQQQGRGSVGHGGPFEIVRWDLVGNGHLGGVALPFVSFATFTPGVGLVSEPGKVEVIEAAMHVPLAANNDTVGR